MMDDEPKVLAVLVFPGGRQEQRYTNPDWVVADLEIAVEQLRSGEAVYVDPEDLPELLAYMFNDWNDDAEPFDRRA